MKNRGLCLLLFAGLVIAWAVSARAARSGALAWRDLAGRVHSAADGGRATLFFFGSTRCQCADGYTSRVRALADQFTPRGARFFLVFAQPEATRAEVEAYAASRGIDFPVVRDPALADRFAVKATPTAVLLDSAGRVRYRGQIDDNPEPVAVRRQYLREALDAVLADRPVPVAATLALGCSIRKGPDEPASRPVVLVEGLGRVQFPITTSNPRAQRFFEQGMAQWYGFNLPEAERTFREVVRLDPKAAMGYWGIALSLGVTYNHDNAPSVFPKARDAIDRALATAGATTPLEQGLIRALAVRHPRRGETVDLEGYRAQMGRVYEGHREDPNVATLYAAALMDLHPWDLWTADGRPRPGTLEAVLVLEDALRRDRDHIGANHFYIHATEGSPDPERALPSARRLAALAPRSGHLVHMPAHTYIRTGDYAASAVSNQQAIGADVAYFAAAGKPSGYGQYLIHNIDFLVASLEIEGRSAEALEASRQFGTTVQQYAPEAAPVFCSIGSGAPLVYLRFRKWDAILGAAAPPAANPFAVALSHFTRGMAFVGKKKIASAEEELAQLRTTAPVAEKAVPEIPLPNLSDGMRGVFRMPIPLLAGKIALAKGDGDAAIRHFREAVAIEETVPYNEPPVWRYPAREALGGALLSLGRAAEAEPAFRQELARHPNSGRALYGLAESLDRQGKADDAARAREEFKKAWARADVTLRVEDL